MTPSLQEKLCRINARMTALLALVRKSLDGQGPFGVEEIQQIRVPLDEMEPIVAESASLRRTHPEIAPQLDLYKSQLRELLLTVQRVHVTLLLRRAQLDARQHHHSSVSQWADALNLTRP